MSSADGRDTNKRHTVQVQFVSSAEANGVEAVLR